MEQARAARREPGTSSAPSNRESATLSRGTTSSPARETKVVGGLTRTVTSNRQLKRGMNEPSSDKAVLQLRSEFLPLQIAY